MKGGCADGSFRDPSAADDRTLRSRAVNASRSPARLAAPQLLTRWLRYAEATAVRFEVVPRHRGWSALGLPDLRGFAPQRRVVRRWFGEPPEFPRRADVAAARIGFDDLTLDEIWLLHDLAHVLWYDVATLTFGAPRWRERDFFLTQHLVSEAFAVLLLDYHVLSQSRHHGLAVDLDFAGWERARERIAKLPALDSFAMCRELVRHYLAGDSRLFTTPPRASGADAELLSRWRDHEASYSEKQRWYVFLWWDALTGRPLSNVRAEIDDPTIAELVWLTLQQFTSDPEPAFEAHVERAARRLRDAPDPLALEARVVAAEARGRPDFRFRDAAAFDAATLAAIVERAREPAAEELFLFWQLLATTTPERLTAAERVAVAALAASVQTATPDRAAWATVRELCRRRLAEGAASTDPASRAEWRAAFFLP